MKWMKLDPSQYSDADRQAIDPPIEVDMATWSPNGGLDWWVKERQQWWGRARSKDGRHRVIGDANSPRIFDW